jgi:hypothetical protein
VDKASEVCNAIKAAQKAAGEIFSGNPGISATQYHMSVLVDGMRNLDQIPGEVELIDRSRDQWPWKARKTFDGVEFYVLLTQGEYEAVRQS